MSISKLKRKDSIRLRVPYPVRQFIRALAINKVTGEIIAKLFQEKIPHRGCRIDTSAKRIGATDKAALFFHLYERSEIDQTIAYLDNNYDVIELGGSIGANSTQIVRRVRDTAKVIIVEADPEICGILSQNISINSSHPQVSIINAAIDYSGASKVLFAKAQDTRRGHLSGGDQGVDECVEVSATTLGSLVNQFDVGRYILVSDIEGAEVGMFLNDREALAKCLRIIIEIDGGLFEGRYYSIDDIVNLAKEANFRVVHRHANRMVFENQVFN